MMGFNRLLLAAAVICSLSLNAADTTSAVTWMPFNASGKWGFIERDAEKVEFKLQPTYELAYPFNSGRAAVQKEKLWGFIDSTGTVVIPHQFDEIRQGGCHAGVAIVRKGPQYGVINTAGAEVLPFIYKNIVLDEKAERLVATIPSADTESPFGLSGIFELNGKVCLPCEYTNIHAFFKNGVTVVEKGGKRGLVTRTGQALSPVQYEQMLHIDIPHFIAVKDGGKTHDIYDEHGVLLFSASYPYVGQVSDQRAVFKDSETKLNGYLDAKGQIVIPASFVFAGAFSEGLAIVQRKLGGPVEAIDPSGASVGSAPNAFVRLDKFKHGFVWLADRTDKQLYLYNTRLEKVFPQGFYYASDFDANGLSRAQFASKINGLINEKGEWVLQPEWSAIELSGVPGIYIISNGRDKGLASASGQVLVKPQAISIEKWDDQFLKIAPQGFSNSGGAYHCFWRKDGVMFYTK